MYNTIHTCCELARVLGLKEAECFPILCFLFLSCRWVKSTVKKDGSPKYTGEILVFSFKHTHTTYTAAYLSSFASTMYICMYKCVHVHVHWYTCALVYMCKYNVHLYV